MRGSRTVTLLRATVALVALCAAMVLAQDTAVIRGEPESQRTDAPAVQLEVADRDQTERRVQERQAGTGALRRERQTPEDADWWLPPPAAPPPQGGRGGRGGRVKEKVIENKKEEFGELMQGLGQLVASYGQLPPDKLQAFKATATTGRGEGALQGQRKSRVSTYWSRAIR